MSQSAVLTEWFRHVPEDKWLRDPAACKADAQSIWEKLQLQSGVKVFECPCGKADISFPMARLGASVCGMDFNAHFIAAAKNKFARADLPGDFTAADVRTGEFPGNVDLIVNWSSSFGYFSDKGNTDLLKRFANALKANGRLLIEVANPQKVIAGEATRIIASGEVVAETWDSTTHRATVVFPATEFRGPVSASVRIYTKEEFTTMLSEAGFAVEGFYGPGFSEFTDESPRLIILANKK